MDALIEPGRCRYIHEFPPTPSIGLVVEESNATPPGNEQVRPTIAVVVGHCDAVGVEPRFPPRQSFLNRPRLSRLGTCRRLGCGRACRGTQRCPFVHPCETATTGQEYVEQPIAVVVDKAHAATDRFKYGEMIGRVLAVAIREGDPGGAGDILEQPGSGRIFSRLDV